MCGINGIVDFSKSERNFNAEIKAMNNALKRRGPDHQAFVKHHHITLGHTRLSILDTHQRSHQPMQDHSGTYSIIFNGEVYNYVELKNEHLPEVPFNTHSDTEVVLEMFKKYGPDCLSHFNGMFAVCILNHSTHEVFLARDRMGIKPLYYSISDNALIFSSQLKGILSSGLIKKTLNKRALNDYLRWQSVPEPFSIIENVHVFPAGHYALFKSKWNSPKAYFSFKASTPLKSTPKQQALQNIRSLFFKAVQLRLRADVPFAAFLSGGIDSSAIVGAMSHTKKDHTHSLSVVFNENEYSEEKYAQLIAKKFETKHTNIRLQATDLLEMINPALQAMDQPSADGINTYLISKVTREKGIKMALSGLGGDELFCGYDLFVRLKKIHRLKFLFAIPRPLRVLVGKILFFKSTTAHQKLKEIAALPAYNIKAIHEILRSTFSAKDIKAFTSFTPSTPHPHNSTFNTDTHLFSEVSLLEYQQYLKHTLLRDSDVMSLAHGLEVRVPFLDHQLITYVLGLSDQLKYPTVPKKLLLESLGDMLPKEITHRKKMGFTFPWEKWIKNELKPLCEKAIDDLAKRPYFNTDALKDYFNAFINGSSNTSWARIWTLVALELWLTENQIE